MHGWKLADFADAGDSDERRRLMSTNQHSAESVPVARQPIRRHHEPQQQHQYDAHTPTHSLSTIYCLSAVYCPRLLFANDKWRRTQSHQLMRQNDKTQMRAIAASPYIKCRRNYQGAPTGFFSRGGP